MKYKIHYPACMAHFGDNAVRDLGFEKYNPYEDREKPVLFCGLYHENDYKVFSDHLGLKAIFWNGNDVVCLSENPQFQALIKTYPRVKHACHNVELQNELKLLDIQAKIKPIFFGDIDRFKTSFKPSLRLQVYSIAHSNRLDEYGVRTIEDIAEKLPDVDFHIFGLKLIDLKNVFYYDVLPEAEFDAKISQMQMCLRLNEHDGLSQTVIKAKLMGHRIISKMERLGCITPKNKVELIEIVDTFAKKQCVDEFCKKNYIEMLNDFSWLDVKKDGVSLVMIVKNEEKGLENAILSCNEFVEEIIISVDDASTDKTREIAKKYADVLKIHTWQDDFSLARNEAASGVKTKWILFLDGHEFVKECSNLETYLGLDVDGLAVRVVMEDGFNFYYPRIYRNDVKMEGAVHNMPICKNVKKFKDFEIQHDRENSQAKDAIDIRIKQRDEMLPRIMEDRIKENKKDTRALFYLALHFSDRGQVKKAMKLYKKYLRHSDQVGERFCSLVNISYIFYQKQRYWKALRYVGKADKEEPNRWETRYLLGLNYMELEWWPRAAEMLVESLSGNKQDYAFNPVPFDLFAIWNLICTCFFRQGKFTEAVVASEKAMEYTKDEKKLGFIRNRIAFIGKLIQIEKDKQF